MWTLERWNPDDFDVLFDIRPHRQAMGPYVERIWGWDDADQRVRFRRMLHPNVRKIVVAGVVVGMLDVHRTDCEMDIGNIELAPGLQGRGVGSAILQSLLDEADERGTPVRLQVFKVNDRARRLYELLGFEVTGETETHYAMAHALVVAVVAWPAGIDL